MTELEKLKAAKEVWLKWSDDDAVTIEWTDWLINEIGRLEDPHKEAKNIIARFSETNLPWHLTNSEVKGIRKYVDHIKSEISEAKAAAGPLDPMRVLATAAKVCDGSINFHNGTDQRIINETAQRLIWLCGINAEPYEVKE